MCNARPKGTPTQVAEISGGSGQDAKAQRSVLGRFGSREVMSLILLLGRKWVDWYRVLRYGKAFSFADSSRYGLWRARG